MGFLELRWLAQGHTTRPWESWGLSEGHLLPLPPEALLALSPFLQLVAFSEKTSLPRVTSTVAKRIKMGLRVIANMSLPTVVGLGTQKSILPFLWELLE